MAEGKGKGYDDIDPMLRTLMDKDVMDTMSTLIAKMESITFEENKTSVFRTPWGRSLFNLCCEKLLGAEGSRSFNIDQWFSYQVKHSKSTRRDIDPSMYQQPIETDWLSALLQLEMKFSDEGNKKASVLQLLHNIMQLEDSAQDKLSKYSKVERQYNFEGVQMSRPSAGPDAKLLMPAPAPAPKQGSMESLLARK